MNWTLFSAFIAATAVLIIIPGPNVMLVISRSMRFGVKAGLITVAGTAFALAQQLAITALGLASAMAVLSDGFEVLRWLGVAYLVYLGVQAFREKPVPPEAAAVTAPGTGRMFFQAAFVAWTNPKLLAFYAAFFPQFLDPALPAGPQLWAMCGAFLAIAVLFDSGYAVIGGRLLGAVKSERAQRIRNRITGGMLIAAGAGLAMVRRT
ncbi:LysE family translocator [Thalassospiraceae bacterium LMO-SO8]|nr:LysE family translocator [Alphaproteobacteria bacterium LMO-S08]WND77430.1 LysE family translocator [Thalassospiraceae bacterium LMO-SO8]